MTTHTLKRHTTIVINNDLNRRLFYMVLAAFVVVSALYLYFLGNIVFAVLERKTIETKIAVLSQEVNDLEINYLAANNTINLARATELGFSEAKAAVFANRTDLARSVSLR